VLEALWSALRSKDVYAVGADKSGDPRAKLIPDALRGVHSASILTALDLDAGPDAHLRKLAGDLGEVAADAAMLIAGALEKMLNATTLDDPAARAIALSEAADALAGGAELIQELADKNAA
jgi:hypothetical protein